MKELEIVDYETSQLEKMVQLFKNSIYSVCKNDYNKKQLDAWAGTEIDLDSWDRNFSDSYTIVAKHNGTIVGFSNITDSGYIDMMYVHADFQNRGIATALYNNIEKYSLSYYFMTLSTHASITAKDFFVSRGFTVVRKQQVIRNATTLENYICTKYLGGNYKKLK